MIDLRNVLSTSATVPVQAHWDPIENTTHNLHWATEEKFNRSKAQWQEPVDNDVGKVVGVVQPRTCAAIEELQHNGFPSLSPAINC